MMGLQTEITTLCKNERQSAEMMQGCTNHTAYAEITAKQILARMREVVKAIENPTEDTRGERRYTDSYDEAEDARHDGFELARQAVLKAMED